MLVFTAAVVCFWHSLVLYSYVNQTGLPSGASWCKLNGETKTTTEIDAFNVPAAIYIQYSSSIRIFSTTLRIKI